LQQLRLTHYNTQPSHLHFRSEAVNQHLSSFETVAGTAAEESVRALTHFPKHATLKELDISVEDLIATLEALLCSRAARAVAGSVVTLNLKVCACVRVHVPVHVGCLWACGM